MSTVSIHSLSDVHVHILISAAVDVSLASSLLGIPFSTNPGALTIFQCSSAKKLVKL